MVHAASIPYISYSIVARCHWQQLVLLSLFQCEGKYLQHLSVDNISCNIGCLQQQTEIGLSLHNVYVSVVVSIFINDQVLPVCSEVISSLTFNQSTLLALICHTAMDADLLIGKLVFRLKILCNLCVHCTHHDQQDTNMSNPSTLAQLSAVSLAVQPLDTSAWAKHSYSPQLMLLYSIFLFGFCGLQLCQKCPLGRADQIAQLDLK